MKYFVEAGAMAVRRVKKSDLKIIAKATGAAFLTSLTNMEGEESFDASMVGEAAEVSQERICDDELSKEKKSDGLPTLPGTRICLVFHITKKVKYTNLELMHYCCIRAIYTSPYIFYICRFQMTIKNKTERERERHVEVRENKIKHVNIKPQFKVMRMHLRDG